MTEHEKNTPFRRAFQAWNDAHEIETRFEAKADKLEALWLETNPAPTAYCITNMTERDEALRRVSEAGISRVPHPCLSSDPSDLANPNYEPFDTSSIATLWGRSARAVLFFDGEPVAKHPDPFGPEAPCEQIELMLNHEARRSSAFRAVEKERDQLWGVTYDRMMDVLRTPASDLQELATRQAIYSLNTVEGPFTGFVAIRESISADVARLMGEPLDGPAIGRLRHDTAMNGSRYVEYETEAEPMDAAA